ncbi:MAG: tetratricopeptide repeat protein [Xanthobacteraceae bacterium]|nr:tetratricopeptide repeat protein [Xanthobacteraceae bacterium]
MAKRSPRYLALIAGGALTIALPPLAGAVDSGSPVRDPQPQSSTSQSGKPAKAYKKKTKKEKKSEQQFIDGYKAAHATIYRRHDYARGIDMLKALGHDDNPDVANLIGYSSRKLGRYEDSKIWYERALAADPSHSRTWSYYGMWHAEQGNLLKAREHLAKVASLCGTKCRDYTELKGVIEGTRTY